MALCSRAVRRWPASCLNLALDPGGCTPALALKAGGSVKDGLSTLVRREAGSKCQQMCALTVETGSFVWNTPYRTSGI